MADSQRADDFASEIFRRLKARRSSSPFPAEEQIGEGAMSLVWRARDEDLHRDVAKKVLRDEKASDQRRGPSTQSLRVARFLDEAQVTAQLDHPGVVPVHQLGLDENERLFFTMKLVRGQTLKEVFELVHGAREGWTVTRATGVLLKVCEAMSYAHSKKVLHRDLKPSNVMVGRFGEVYVMDWGLARVLGRPDEKDIRIREPVATTSQVDTDRHELADSDPGSPLYTMDGDVVGTPAYMSPEQAHGVLERIGPQSDVYAVGAILYHLLSGQMPYVSPATRVDNYAVWRWVREGPPAPLAVLAHDAPPELVAICDKAMERDVARRYASMQEVADELRAYLELRVVRAHKTGAIVELRKWIARNKAVAGLLGALAIVVGAGGYWIAAVNARGQQHAHAALRGADVWAAAELQRQAAELGPIHPANASRIQAWLDEARALLDRAAGYRDELAARIREARTSDVAIVTPGEPDAALLASAQAWDDRAKSMDEKLEQKRKASEQPKAAAEVLAKAAEANDILPRESTYWRARAAELRQRATARERVAFAKDAQQRSYDQLARIVALSTEIERAIPRGEADLQLARSLAQRTLIEAQPQWDAARASIGNTAEGPLYAGLPIQPQLGLVPLRRDPRSGLWEFWHVLSGDRPALDAATDHWIIGPQTGLVLVLVPGGVVQLGAQTSDANSPRYDSAASATEKLSAPFDLAPFFLSKYEMTQGQWLRATGEMPSTRFAGLEYFSDPRITRAHPVESVTWEAANHVLERWALALPTEARWEHAARAGGIEPYGRGRTFGELAGTLNCLDRTYIVIGRKEESPSGLLDDGFVLHAAVDRFTPNAWGFHNLLGNVEEWCRDSYGDSCAEYAIRAGDGERMPKLGSGKVVRGGHYGSSAGDLRVSARAFGDPRTPSELCGVRPARSLDP